MMTKILASLMLLVVAVYCLAAITFGVWIITRLINS